MILNNKLYDILKWVCLIVIPALSTFLGIMLPTVGVDPSVSASIISIITGLGAFIGSIIGISTAQYAAEKNKDESHEIKKEN